RPYLLVVLIRTCLGHGEYLASRLGLATTYVDRNQLAHTNRRPPHGRQLFGGLRLLCECDRLVPAAECHKRGAVSEQRRELAGTVTLAARRLQLRCVELDDLEVSVVAFERHGQVV